MTRITVQDGDEIQIDHPTAVTISPVSGEGDGMPMAAKFRLPMANIDKAWYEAARHFGPYNEHPERCEDWNLESGGDTDLGEPLVAPFSGVVINARDWGGAWGKIVRILGRTPQGELVTWMGAHLDEMHVKPGDVVQVGDPVGTIGTADGRYAAHLHEQVSVGEVPAPWTFGGDRRFDFRQPSEFYKEHGVDAELVRRSVEYDGE
jgi:hypothetical protein